MHVLRWEWPPWKSFMEQRQEALTRFEQAVKKAHEGAKADIDRAEHDALRALRLRRHQRADATSG